GHPAICSFCQAFGHDTKRCKTQPQPKTMSEWVKVAKSKATVTNFIVSPPEHTEPSSSNFPVIQNATPEADNLAPPLGEQQEIQEPQIEEQEQEVPEVADQVMLNDRASLPGTPLTRSQLGFAKDPVLMEGHGTREAPLTPFEDKDPDPPRK
ncbi:hypothetical protein U1Q18_039345, partial [Sarracenia purpurea var. burkii]